MPRRLLFALLLFALSGCGVVAAPSSSAPSPSPTPTPLPTATPSPSPSPSPSPAPSPTPEGGIGLEVIGCEGGAVLEWSVSADASFHHYIAMRSPERRIDPSYPPIAPAVDWGDTYTTDRFVTSAVDSTLVPTEREWHYRVMAYDVDGDVVGESNVESARHHPVVDLGALAVSPIGDLTRLVWNGYDGDPRCFSSYRIVYGTDGVPANVLSVVTDQATPRLATDHLQSGTAYVLRVDAVRTTAMGTVVVGSTELASYVAR